jgi:transcriptional repressor NrdR
MICPYCSQDNDRVIDSRAADAGKTIRRRRECLACTRRFTTYERAEDTIRLMVIKRDGSRVPYDRVKLLNGLLKACFKRPVTPQRVEQIVDELEEQMFRHYEKEIDSVEIGRLASEKLKAVDQVAYVRFASVYKQFKDIEDLLDEVKQVMQIHPDRPEQGKLF